MKTITVAGPKGGCGKTLTTASLAVRAAGETGRVALLDMNEDQGTLTEWWTLRGRPVNPYLHTAEGTLDELVADLDAANWTYGFIDGPPAQQDLIEMTVIVADAVLIPVKLSYFDTSAIDSIVGICTRRKKPFAFVINEFDDRKLFETANAIGIKSLEGRGQILETRIPYDPKHRVGQVRGLTGPELEKGQSGPIGKNISALWAEVKALASVPSLKLVGGGRHG